jgi:hypothetical protein
MTDNELIAWFIVWGWIAIAVATPLVALAALVVATMR